MNEMNGGFDLMREFGSYTAWKLTEHTHIISFMNGSQFMYLLEGDDKALLIDTGWGAGNLREFVEKLTAKPIIVCNTHFHPDHAGGNGEWKEVYVHHNWAEDAETLAGTPFNLSTLPHPDYTKLLLKDGDTIDLGGRVLDACDISAHSHSSLAFVDRKNSMIFCGDEIESAQVLLYTDETPDTDALAERLKLHKSNMLKLKECCSKFDRPGIANYFPAHNGTPISNAYCDAFIALTDAIFDGTAIIDEKLNHFYIERQPGSEKIARVRNNSASFFVYREQLMKIYGKGNR